VTNPVAPYAEVTRSVATMRSQASEIRAEMVANVLSVDVAVGDAVAAGDTVLLLESMKMEIPVIAEVGGVVRTVKVDAGDVVQEGDLLLELG
jgi:acetyl-CoA carboxylase biotin carboxyl carrier protein